MGQGDNHGFSEEMMVKRRKAIADPVRQRIMHRLEDDEWGAVDGQAEPRDWTAKEIAQALGLEVNGLYYHLRLLEDAELIGVVGQRAPGKMVERTYRLASNRLLTWTLDEEFVAVLAGQLETAKREVEEAVYEAARAVEDAEEMPGWLGFSVESPGFRTSREEVIEFHRRLKELVAEFRSRAADLREIKTGEPIDWTRLRLTWALRERPLPAT